MSICSYARPAAAARWLAQAFGFEPMSDLPVGPDPLPEDEHGHPWIELRVGNAVLNVHRQVVAAGVAVSGELRADEAGPLLVRRQLRLA